MGLVRALLTTSGLSFALASAWQYKQRGSIVWSCGCALPNKQLVIYPLPPPAAGEAQRGDAAPLARPPPPDATLFAAAAAALAGPATRIIVAFEARPAGVPGPGELRGALVAATDARFSIHSRLDAAGLAFAGAPHIERHEWGGVREGV